ncbi:23S rRNA pseudouridine2605 synthase [[Eubacterium] yurii]|jgi:pseudouridylate synthase|nr:23S rRNA pseudouridine2605 synthase [[Eubacterium] yurii]
MRINKFIATKTAYSRRKADELIKEKKVKINGKVLENLAYTVNDDDEVELDGRIISDIKVKKYYYLFNKPKNVVSTVSDEFGRYCITDFFPPDISVFPVGRLDYDSRGLIIVTNDGDLANKIAHPSHHVKKTYIATLDGRLSEVQMKKFSEGVVIDSKKTLPAEIELFDFSENQYKISIYEGRNRQIRKMIEVLGRNVRELKRISIGKIKLGRIVEGKYRKLTEEEKNYLFDL